MKITYDTDIDIAYIYFVEPHTVKVSYTVELAHNIIADYDYLHGLVGMEILNASSLIGAPDSIKNLEFQDFGEE
jgi:uncharacterized protein YuzE